MPRRSRRLNPPNRLDALSDDLFLRAFVRAPFVCHGTLHSVSKRFKSLLRSDAFREQRLESGLAEHGVVLACARRMDHACMISSGCVLEIPPMSGPRRGACSVIIDNEMWSAARQ